MNDFSELENELKKLRPAQPSPVLFQCVEQTLEGDRASVPRAKWKRWRLTQTPYNWLSLGFGVAAAAVLILFAAVNMERGKKQGDKVAQISPVPETKPISPARLDGSGAQTSTSSDRFVPAGATQIVYNTRDEGLQFARGSEQPLRRLRYQTHQTWKWRNPATGASLRVSYPSEEVVLIPVSGQ